MSRVFDLLGITAEDALTEMIFDDGVERALWQQKWMRDDERKAMLTFYKLIQARRNDEAA